MHTGEDFFQLGWPHFATLAVLLTVYLILVFKNKLPSMSAFKEFTDTINTAGGHIIVLLVMVGYATKITFQLFYHVLSLPEELLSKSDTLINMMLTFCTTTLIMLPLGALIKGMTGGKAVNGNGAPVADRLTASLVPANGEKK